MNENPSKTKRQLKGIETWRLNKGIGTLNYVQRFGKTYVAKIIVDRFIERAKVKEQKTLKESTIIAICPNDITYKNLRANLAPGVIILTMNKAMNMFDELKNTTIDLLIVDEIHRFTYGHQKILLGLESTFRLGLTGDRLSKDALKVLKANNFQVIDSIDEEEAVLNGWISESVEYNIPVDIEDYKKDAYTAYTKKIKEITDLYKDVYRKLNSEVPALNFRSDSDLMYSLYGGFTYKSPTSKGTVYIKGDIIRQELARIMGWSKDMDMSIDRNQQLDMYYNPSELHKVAKLYCDIVRNRNELIINSKNKIEKVLEIISANPVPTIIFNESTSMASMIAQALGDEAIEYHSNVDSKYIKDPNTNEYVCGKNGKPIKFGKERLKKFAIEGINVGLFKYICTAKALNEGVNIPILEQVITTGGSTNPSTHMQRIARGKTYYEENPTKLTKIINVYIRDFTHEGELVVSRDASKLKTRQKDSFVYWVESIDEIFSDIS
jgi:superfamily II DNA or RNA helicase